jgi:hypothetical protein
MTGTLHALQGLLAGARLSYKRSHLVALRRTKISASDPPSLASSKIDFHLLRWTFTERG